MWITYHVQFNMVINGGRLPEVHSASVITVVEALNPGHAEHGRSGHGAEKGPIAERRRFWPHIRRTRGWGWRWDPFALPRIVAVDRGAGLGARVLPVPQHEVDAVSGRGGRNVARQIGPSAFDGQNRADVFVAAFSPTRLWNLNRKNSIVGY